MRGDYKPVTYQELEYYPIPTLKQYGHRLIDLYCELKRVKPNQAYRDLAKKMQKYPVDVHFGKKQDREELIRQIRNLQKLIGKILYVKEKRSHDVYAKGVVYPNRSVTSVEATGVCSVEE